VIIEIVTKKPISISHLDQLVVGRSEHDAADKQRTFYGVGFFANVHVVSFGENAVGHRITFARNITAFRNTTEFIHPQ
jgi:hypothetical protein